ncbi:MAG TPA: tripartite tricarboxylate transporter substrate binding protein [Ramlibacter sp.]|nr:tripartite tricarboxylate transporter substrate binding protein [Ramlibacter sp.]
MKYFTRTILFILALAAAASASAQTAATYPAKPVRVIVAAAPGGLADVTTRLVLQKLTDRMGQSFVVENRPGDPVLGIRAVKAAPADGYTLLATSSSITSQPYVKHDPGYDLQKDLVGISQLVRSPFLMVVGAPQPDKTLADFLARARKDPSSMSFASGGVGTAPYLAAESFLQRAGLNLLHVPYKGNGAAMPDLIAGRVTMMFEGAGSGAPKLRNGTMRALAVTSAKRIPAFPDIPTLAELGYPNNFTSQVWIGLFAPSGVPREIVLKLNEGIQAVLASPEMRKRYEADGAEAVSMTPDEFNDSLKREMLEMEKLVGTLGLQKQ